MEDGCILWGTRVVVPPQLRSRVMDELNRSCGGTTTLVPHSILVMDELHEGHPGMGRMKVSLALCHAQETPRYKPSLCMCTEH